MIKRHAEKHIPETVDHNDATYTRGRWISLRHPDGSLKAESSSDDLLQFYEPGDQIYIQYTRTEDIAVNLTDEFLKDYDLKKWQEDEDD